MSHARALLRLTALLLVLAPHGLAAFAVFGLGLAPSDGAKRLALRLGPRVTASWGRWTLRAMGVRLDLPAPAPTGPFVIASNHLTWVDIPVLATVFRGQFVAKGEIAGWPGIGQLSRAVGTIFLQRARARHVLEGAEAMRACLGAGTSVVVFAEGTTSRGADVAPFRSALLQAAADTGLPCLPVAVSYVTPGAPWGTGHTVAWWGGRSLGAHGYRLLSLPRLVARVRWSADPLPAADRKVLAVRAHAEVQALFEPLGQDEAPPWGPTEDIPETVS